MTLSPRIGALIGIFLSSLCLVAGFVAAGKWLCLVLAAFVLLVWLTSRRSNFEWLLVMALPAAVLLAAAGAVSGASPYLMIPAATLALLSWDLTLFDRSFAGNVSSPAASRLVRRHYANLGLILCVGLLAAAAGRLFSVQLPFTIVLVVVAALSFFLDRAWRTFHR